MVLSMRSLIGNRLTSNCCLFQIVRSSRIGPTSSPAGVRAVPREGDSPTPVVPPQGGGMATGRPSGWQRRSPFGGGTTPALLPPVLGRSSKWMATEEPLRGRAGPSTSPSAGTEKKMGDGPALPPGAGTVGRGGRPSTSTRCWDRRQRGTVQHFPSVL